MLVDIEGLIQAGSSDRVQRDSNVRSFCQQIRPLGFGDDLINKADAQGFLRIKCAGRTKDGKRVRDTHESAKAPRAEHETKFQPRHAKARVRCTVTKL